jgi:hypothetical protein
MMVVKLDDILIEVESEMNHAVTAREQGREGRARVCARRAAGQAVAFFHQRETGTQPHANYYRLLQWFQDVDGISDGLKEAAERLTTRVTPDYSLPHPHDPLQDARMLIEALLFEENDNL